MPNRGICTGSFQAINQKKWGSFLKVRVTPSHGNRFSEEFKLKLDKQIGLFTGDNPRYKEGDGITVHYEKFAGYVVDENTGRRDKWAEWLEVQFITANPEAGEKASAKIGNEAGNNAAPTPSTGGSMIGGEDAETF